MPDFLTPAVIISIVATAAGVTGALIAASKLGWDIFSWTTSRKVVLKVVPEQGIKYANEDSPNLKVAINNIGSVSTTITRVMICIYRGRLKKELCGSYKEFTGKAYALPFKLEPGAMWEGESLGNHFELKESFPDGTPYIVVSHSQSEKPIKKEIPEPYKVGTRG